MKFLSIVQMMFSALVKPRQHILVSEIPTGRVIDVGGGGEGVISQCGGGRVVAVDKYLSEIHEARGKALEAHWLVADATELPCASHCFDNATAFFSCMYMPDEVKAKVFRETRRVLKPDGEFWIWDANISPKGRVFALRLRVELQDRRTINTIYGVRAKVQSTTKLADQLREAGFEAEVIRDQKYWFLIKARCG